MRPAALVLLGFLAGCEPAIDRSDLTIVRPVESFDVLANPGMGITTFQKYDNHPVNSELPRLEQLPTEQLAPAAFNSPDSPKTTIAYFRWYWSEIQPTQSEIRWDFIDRALAEARGHGQRLAFRLMPYDDKHPLPEWYRRSGARRANGPADRDGSIWQPDYSDPIYLKKWGALVSAAGVRYDGHPSLESVDISSIGYWGEGWSDYMPAFPAQQALIDVYFDAFRHTRLLMNFDQPQALAYATQRGAGWRLDCLGDMGGLWGGFSHMLDQYPQQIARLGLQDVWQRAPVSLETCGTPSLWKEKGWDVSYILAQALRWHVTSLNVKSSPIPTEWTAKFDEFQKRMGYRIVLRRFAFPSRARRGGVLPIQSWWLNAGVAPPYDEFSLALQLRSRDRSATVRLMSNIRGWLPGDIVFDGSVYIPDDLNPGTYTVRIALLDPRTGEPAIRLANEGLGPDGWFELGTILLTE